MSRPILSNLSEPGCDELVIHGGRVVECESRQDKTYTRLPKTVERWRTRSKAVGGGRLSGAYGLETGRYVRRHDGTTRQENANRHKGLVDGA